MTLRKSCNAIPEVCTVIDILPTGHSLRSSKLPVKKTDITNFHVIYRRKL